MTEKTWWIARRWKWKENIAKSFLKQYTTEQSQSLNDPQKYVFPTQEISLSPFPLILNIFKKRFFFSCSYSPYTLLINYCFTRKQIIFITTNFSLENHVKILFNYFMLHEKFIKIKKMKKGETRNNTRMRWISYNEGNLISGTLNEERLNDVYRLWCPIKIFVVLRGFLSRQIIVY